MKIHKKVIAKLNKCYSIAPLTYNGRNYFMVAAEKTDRCILFDRSGSEVGTIWEEPGGVMSMVQVPGSNGQFLAVHRFYSPNDSADAEIVVVTPDSEGGWNVRTLAELPHIHRLDIISHNGFQYLLACTLKSGHEYPDDWSKPGKVYAAVLPEDHSGFTKEHPLPLTVIKDGMRQNHGYYRVSEPESDTAVISAACGVFQFFPPAHPSQPWTIRQLLDTPASDAVLLDLDRDGEKELAVLAPFHGNNISIYKRIRDNGSDSRISGMNQQSADDKERQPETEGFFVKIYEYKKETAFLHALYGCEVAGRPVLLIGYRQAERNILMFSYNESSQSYQASLIDENCGPANVFHYQEDGYDVIIAANREIDEIAMYRLEYRD